LDAADAQRNLLKDAASARRREAERVESVRGLTETMARDGAERGLHGHAMDEDRARRTEVERAAAEAASARRIAREDLGREDERLRRLLQRSHQLRAGLDKADHDHAT